MMLGTACPWEPGGLGWGRVRALDPAGRKFAQCPSRLIPHQSVCHRFEQSSDLALKDWAYTRAHLLRPLIACGSFVAVSAIVILFTTRNSGQSVAPWYWLATVVLGAWVPFATLGLLRFGALRRRFMELQPDGLVLSGVGYIPYSRIEGWRLIPQNHNPNSVRCQITFRDVIGQRSKWFMFIDTREQLEPLQTLLSARVPAADGV